VVSTEFVAKALVIVRGLVLEIEVAEEL